MLQRTVFSPDGRVLAESGGIIDQDLIEKFENFGVRNIAVRENQVHWLSEADAEKLPADAEVVDREEFSEAADEIVESIENTNSIRKMRHIARYLARQSTRSGQAEKSEKLNEIIERSYELQDKIDDLMAELETVEDPEARDKIMTALENTVAEVEETFLEISASDSLLRSTLEAVNEKEDIRSSITDFVNNNPDLLDKDEETKDYDLPVEKVESRYKSLVEACNEGHVISAVNKLEGRTDSSEVKSVLEDIKADIQKEIETESSLKKQLVEETTDLKTRSDMLEVLEGRKEPTRKELKSNSLSKNFVSKTLSFTEEREENRSRLWEAANEVTDNNFKVNLDKENFVEATTYSDIKPGFLGDEETGSEDNEIPEPELNEIVSNLQSDDLAAASEKLLDIANQSKRTDSSLAAKIKMAGENSKELDKKIEQLVKDIEEEVGSSQLRKKLIAVVEENRELAEEEGSSVSSEVRSRIEGVNERRQNQQKRLWEAADELSGGEAQQVEAKSSSNSEIPTGKKVSQEKESSGTGETDESSKKRRTVLPGKDQDLYEVLAEGDEYDVSDLTGLDLQTVRTSRYVLDKPRGGSPRLETWLTEAKKAVQAIFYGRNYSENEISNLIAQTRTLLENNGQPLDLIFSPPDEERYLFTHTINVFAMSIFLGCCIDFAEEKLLDLAGASLSIDLGMMEIPRALWLKEGNLTNRGWGEVHKHPLISREIMGESLNHDSELIDLVSQHHEKIDGSGYPGGLEGEEQHPLAPLLSVADAYTALLEPRPHRSAQTPDKALLILLKNKNEYSRSTSKIILNEVGFYPDGSLVELSDGRLAQIRGQGEGNPLSPVVLVLTDPDQNRLNSPIETNLSNKSNLKVNKILKY